MNKYWNILHYTTNAKVAIWFLIVLHEYISMCACSYHGVCVHTSNVSLSACFVYGLKLTLVVYAFCMFHLYLCRSSVDCTYIILYVMFFCCVSVAIGLFTTTVVDVLGTIMLAF